MSISWEHRYAQRMQRVKSSAIREILKISSRPDIISFGGGYPAPDAFPDQEFRTVCERVLRHNSSMVLQYSITEGYLPLRELIAEKASDKNLKVTPDNILITSGSQQALDLIGKLMINEGDHVLLENPTYLGALQALNVYGAEYLPVPMDEDGIIIEEARRAIKNGPKIMYILPTFQNPSGVTMPLSRRRQLVELSEEFGVPIIEDDPYGKLRYSGEHLPSLQTIDCQINPCSPNYDGNVIYLSTFSKLLAPGLRLAWVIASEQVIRKLVMLKQGADLHTSTFNQVVAYEVAKDGFLEKHIEKIRSIYVERRNVMLETLEEHMPPSVHWTKPDGGLFLWISLPENISSFDVYKDAIEQKVAFAPGNSFYACGGGENTMRLNFSNATPAEINEGIARLGRAIHKNLK